MIDTAEAPSPDLVRALAGVDPTTLNETDLLALIAGWEQVRSYVQSCQNDAFVAWERLTTPPAPDSDAARANHRWASDELGLVIGLTSHQAWARVERAVTLAEKLPETTAALRTGRISVTHAERAAERARNVTPVVAREVDRAVMAAGNDWRTPSQLERVFAAELIRVDPDGAAHRANLARRDRAVRVRPEPDGMATLSAFLPAADAQAIHAAVDAHARSSKATNTPGDDRTLGERRCDALRDLVVGAGSSDRSPKAHGRRRQVNVTVAWSTLVGLDDLPADLTGYGPIDADTARRLAADPDSVWRRLLVDPLSGRLMDYGTCTYAPPQDLMDFVVARDTMCRFPGCEQQAVVCDLDHRRPYGTCGGVTAPGNIDPLCRAHHRLKHEGGWTHERDPETGDSVWITPAGRRYGRAAHVHPHGGPVEPPGAAAAPTDSPPPF